MPILTNSPISLFMMSVMVVVPIIFSSAIAILSAVILVFVLKQPVAVVVARSRDVALELTGLDAGPAQLLVQPGRAEVLGAVQAVFRRHGFAQAAVIGQVLDASGAPLLRVAG